MTARCETPVSQFCKVVDNSPTVNMLSQLRTPHAVDIATKMTGGVFMAPLPCGRMAMIAPAPAPMVRPQTLIIPTAAEVQEYLQ